MTADPLDHERLRDEVWAELGVVPRRNRLGYLCVAVHEAHGVGGVMRARRLRTYGVIAWSPQGEQLSIPGGSDPPLTLGLGPDEEAAWLEDTLRRLEMEFPDALVEISLVHADYKWPTEALLRIAAELGVPVAGDWGVPMVPVGSAGRMVDVLEREGLPLWGIESFQLGPDGEMTGNDGQSIDIPMDETSFDAARAVLASLPDDRWVFLDLVYID